MSYCHGMSRVWMAVGTFHVFCLPPSYWYRRPTSVFLNVPWSKVAILGMVIPPLIGIPLIGIKNPIIGLMTIPHYMESTNEWLASYSDIFHSNEIQTLEWSTDVQHCSEGCNNPLSNPKDCQWQKEEDRKGNVFLCVLLPRYNTIFPHLGIMVETLHWHSHSKTTFQENMQEKIMFGTEP